MNLNTPSNLLELNQKIVDAFGRISDVFKILLWEKAKAYGVSPIQIQLLLFIANHKKEFSNVTQLTREFNLTKPTISDAVRVLIQKNYLAKDPSPIDNRSHSLIITKEGDLFIQNLLQYTSPLNDALAERDISELETLYSTMTSLLFSLKQKEIIQVQRMCHTCKYFQNQGTGYFCHLLQQSLAVSEIRIDCPEHETTP